jgi:DNA-binding transcriptional MerR regulator
MYGADELRRLAFIKVAQRLGLPLSTSAAVLDAPGPQWRQTVRQQIVELSEPWPNTGTRQASPQYSVSSSTHRPHRSLHQRPPPATLLHSLHRGRPAPT